MQLTLDEISPGIVVMLDTSVLRAHGGATTNAVTDSNGDRAVTGAYRFLVVYVDATRSSCTAVPLYDRSAVGNQPLDDGKKSGPRDGWIGEEWFFSHWQHWRMPLAAVAAASAPESTEPTQRRRYANGERSALDDIRVWETRNRAEYRAV